MTPTKDSYTTSWPHRTTAYHRAGCKKLHKTDTLTKTQRRHCAIRLRHYTQGVAERHTRRSRPPWRRRQQQPLAWSKSSCSSAPKRPSARHLSRATPEPPQPNRSKATTSTSSNTWTPPLTPLQPPTTHSNPHSSPLSHSHTSNGNTYKQQPRQPSANTYPPPRPSQSTHGSHKQLGSSYNNDLQHASHRDTILRLSSTRTSGKQARKDKTQWPKDRLAESEPLLTHAKNGSGSRECGRTTSPGRSQYETHRASPLAFHSKPKPLQNYPARLSLGSTPNPIHWPHKPHPPCSSSGSHAHHKHGA